MVKRAKEKIIPDTLSKTKSYNWLDPVILLSQFKVRNRDWQPNSQENNPHSLYKGEQGETKPRFFVPSVLRMTRHV